MLPSRFTVLPLVGIAFGAAAATLLHRRTIRQLEIDPTYGVLTRAGFERRAARLRAGYDLVLFDIDGFKQLNSVLGYAEVNKLMHAALQLRDADVLFVWRHFSGDEIGLVVRAGQGHGLVQRLEARLAAFGLRATFAVITRPPLSTAIAEAEHQVQMAKAARSV